MIIDGNRMSPTINSTLLWLPFSSQSTYSGLKLVGLVPHSDESGGYDRSVDDDPPKVAVPLKRHGADGECAAQFDNPFVLVYTFCTEE